uniref:DUF3172 domain-containing protein n=1 Tax=Odontella aurita TaxID=265563 RepID=A0A7S4I7G3_9STRA|mmetsp:Transcript_20922/g.60924  ORF Transcript_20922/g.60924 Transcript_20922/m.60924 type:complete len:311 (+) Transcript_20922:113-1045(+)
MVRRWDIAAALIVAASAAAPTEAFSFPSSSLVRSESRVSAGTRRIRTYARRGDKDDDDRYYDDDDDDDYYYDDRGGDDYDRPQRRRRRRPADDLGTSDGGAGMEVPSPFGLRSGLRLPDSVSKALLAGIFVLGIGAGVAIESQVNTSPKDLASRDAIDKNAPNPTLCAQYGASAMAFDQRVFVSFNPFNVYVAQADVKPACVLRQSNVVQVLKERNLINDNEVRSCKQKVNTWAFVGDLDSMPQISCVYQSDDAQNEFLSNPKLGIGEDVYDDDRAALERKKSTGKQIKSGMTEAQMKKMAQEFDGSLGT